MTAAAGTVFFSFIGLDTVATAAAETRDPKRTVPLGILLGLLIVTVVYMLVAVTALGAQPAAKFEGQEAGWPNSESRHRQDMAAIVLSAGAVISVFSITLVTIYGQTRIRMPSAAMACCRMFQRLARRAAVPGANTIIVSVLVAVVAGTVDSGYPMGHGQPGHAGRIHCGVGQRTGHASPHATNRNNTPGRRLSRTVRSFRRADAERAGLPYIVKDLSTVTFEGVCGVDVCGRQRLPAVPSRSIHQSLNDCMTRHQLPTRTASCSSLAACAASSMETQPWIACHAAKRFDQKVEKHPVRAGMCMRWALPRRSWWSSPAIRAARARYARCATHLRQRRRAGP